MDDGKVFFDAHVAGACSDKRMAACLNARCLPLDRSARRGVDYFSFSCRIFEGTMSLATTRKYTGMWETRRSQLAARMRPSFDRGVNSSVFFSNFRRDKERTELGVKETRRSQPCTNVSDFTIAKYISCAGEIKKFIVAAY